MNNISYILTYSLSETKFIKIQTKSFCIQVIDFIIIDIYFIIFYKLYSTW